MKNMRINRVLLTIFWFLFGLYIYCIRQEKARQTNSIFWITQRELWRKLKDSLSCNNKTDRQQMSLIKRTGGNIEIHSCFFLTLRTRKYCFLFQIVFDEDRNAIRSFTLVSPNNDILRCHFANYDKKTNKQNCVLNVQHTFWLVASATLPWWPHRRWSFVYCAFYLWACLRH